jgi:hypothetical protein
MRNVLDSGPASKMMHHGERHGGSGHGENNNIVHSEILGEAVLL